MKPQIPPRQFTCPALPGAGCRAGFSLVELLVVLAVVAALAALLLGASQKAGSMGAASKCAGNLRSIGVGLMGYVSDHNGSLPPMSALVDPSVPGSDTLMGQKILAAYMGMPPDFNWKDNIPSPAKFGVWICPADQEPRQKTGPDLPRWKSLNSYLLNFYIGKGVVTETGQNAYGKTVLRMTEVRNPNEIWYFADGIRFDGGQGRMTDGMVSAAGETVGEAALRFRHGGTLHALTLAGSVQIVTPAQARGNGERLTTPQKN